MSKQKNRPLILAILDGWGVAEPGAASAISVAETPHMDKWSKKFPSTTLTAHGGLVGLPEGQMGNSEVGHLNIGAGRIVYQDFTRINLAVKSGEFAENPALTGAIDKVQKTGNSIHLLGLLSDGGVHSHINHLFALLRMCKARGLEKVYIHCFMDGRDTPPSSGLEYMEQLLSGIKKIGCGQVATISGRYWGMDRDNRWDRVEKCWQVLVAGEGISAADPVQAIKAAYYRQETDEFIAPIVLGKGEDENNPPPGAINDGDSLVFFNFRADRVRELCHAFIDDPKFFTGFDISNRPNHLNIVTMTEYESDFPFPVAFPPQSLRRIFAEEISSKGTRQLRIAETEKYAHVTYFFNGGRETPFAGETRILIDSPREVATYDKKPEMSAEEVTERLLTALKQAEEEGNPFEVIILNFANCDMVGHTGVFAAAVQAVETVDGCLGKIHDFVRRRDGVMLITADHGNAEIMVDPHTGEPYTAHTLNPVPLVLVSEQYANCKLRRNGALRDIAPTMLALLGQDIPVEMDGGNLLEC